MEEEHAFAKALEAHLLYKGPGFVSDVYTVNFIII
jgi:hypothetical protein